MADWIYKPVCDRPRDGGMSNGEGWTLCGACLAEGRGPVWHKTVEIRDYDKPEVAAARVQAKRAARMEATPANIGKAVARCLFDRRGNHSEAHLSEHELAAIIAEAIKLYATKTKGGN